ncbi:hypothetical protein CVS40_4753 [Lucilia cuprina]|nr:hypothetical protein CVS40_4753 [Lucilia cuprina]
MYNAILNHHQEEDDYSSKTIMRDETHFGALKDNIRQECKDLSPEVLAKVMENAIKRAQMTINCDGGHLYDIIFSTLCQQASDYCNS